MEIAVRSMETAEMAMETDGDGSGGTSLSQQGAGIETSVPWNSLAAAAELRNSFWKIADCFRVFHREASYRQRGIVRRWPGGLTIGGCDQGLGHAPSWCGQPLAPLRLLFGLRSSSGKNRSSGTCFVQFWEYFLCSFSETQKQQKTGNWHCGILLVG
jgi:hypothetical protein